MKAYREGKARGLDGVPLHFTCYGEGERTLLCCNGVGVSTFFWKYVVRNFSDRYRVVTWDYRGHGRSGEPPRMSREKFTIASCVQDLTSVMEAAGIRNAVLLGHSMGTQVVLEAWRRHPSRVDGLVMICGAYGRPLDTFWDSRLAGPIFDVVYAIVNLAPRAFSRGNARLMRSPIPMWIANAGAVDRKMCRPGDLRPYFDHLARVDSQVFFLMAGEMQRHTAAKWLDRVDVPTLVVAGENDRFTPHRLSVHMRDRIPGAELLTIPRGSHAALIEQPELLNLRLEKFLRERIEARTGTAPAPRSTDRPLVRRAAAVRKRRRAKPAPKARPPLRLVK